MTSIPGFTPMTPIEDPLARRTLFVAYEGMGLLDLTGPLAVFWSASGFMEQEGRHGYTRHTVSLDGGPVMTAEGVTIDTAPISQFDTAEIDTIVIPGALDVEPTLADHRLVDWLANNIPKSRRTASLCAGASLSAKDGLLDGRRAVTPWTSAGIDLSLAHVQEDCGREIAIQVARQLVIHMKRPVAGSPDRTL